MAPLETARRLELAAMAARAAVEPLPTSPRDLARRHAIALPGRAEPYTPEAIRLRDPVTAERVVAFVGSLFGGNYDPCPDTRSKLRDLADRNDPAEHEELMRLIDRERRRCR